ncbi:hypothetical protein CEXT_293981 [Caerostris extrusa]|uniref:Uncharacterized protein n=1 Tax=Caerostris extrusa TaxID=172846 RepID=A0AAV4M5V6_CAEEX|nr:hypothetical protein CEXT_293981 [Caerostris extrusa]
MGETSICPASSENMEKSNQLSNTTVDRRRYNNCHQLYLFLKSCLQHVQPGGSTHLTYAHSPISDNQFGTYTETRSFPQAIESTQRSFKTGIHFLLMPDWTNNQLLTVLCKVDAQCPSTPENCWDISRWPLSIERANLSR